MLILLLLALVQDARQIENKVLAQRFAIKSGIVTFTVKTPVHVSQPVYTKISTTYTVYFKNGNYRMDEHTRLVDGTTDTIWRVFAFGRCIQSFSVDDPIMDNACDKRKYTDLGIINPLLLGLVVWPTGAFSAHHENPFGQGGDKAERTVETIDGFKITTTTDIWRGITWVDPHWNVVKRQEFKLGKLWQQLDCKIKDFGGVYFPEQVTYRCWDNGKLEQEQVTTVTDARFNLEFVDDVFSLKALGIPAGRKVTSDNRMKVWNGKKLIDAREP